MKPWKILGFALAISLAASLPRAIADDGDAAKEVRFVREVLPILRSKCQACHGEDPDDLKGEFELRSREAALSGGESGEAGIVPGRPEESALYRAATRTDDFLSAMPPKENDALSAEQLAALAKWIEQGAAWPDAERIASIQQEHADEWSVAGGVRVATSGGLDEDWTGRGYKPEDLWAYRPLPETVPVPDIPGAASPIDAFLNEKMQAAEIGPAPPAGRAALIRRVTFDLTGLPPTAAEVEAFLSDPAPDELAVERVVDRLMASPRYAEQQARHWLDVVRYADSSGFANDYERGNAWRYRDYVVRSFDEDKPYDRFVQEQIAGDELADANDREGSVSDPELLVAAGFLRMGAWELTGMEVEKIARQRFLDDVTDAVGQVFLGHMLQCARCHDHKFDPVPTRDYYAFQAAFATTQLAERPAPFLASENLEGFEERRYLLQRRKSYQEELASLAKKKTLDAARRWYQENGRDASDFERVVREMAAEKNVPPETLSAAEVRARMQKKKVPAERIFSKDAGFEPADFGRERIARKGLERLAWRLERYEPFALSVYAGRTPTLRSVYKPLRVHDELERNVELEQTAILVGGDPFSPSQSVEPGVLSAVLGFARSYPQNASNREVLAGGESFVATATAKSEAVDSRLPLNGDAVAGRREALAEWIVSPENPLTPRVMANRLWQRRFGRGIAGNPNNFGATGKKPTHPELLDWLARRLVETGWSLKALDREIVLSEAYRRSTVHPDAEKLAALDPNGETYARFLPRRLDAEEIRDAALLVTGELNHAIGGIPVRPVMNEEVAFQPRQVMGTFAEAWQPSILPSQRNRRSIYVTKLRGLRDPFFEVFDAPSPELSCEARQTSTVAPQAFSLFNSEQSYSRAIALAHRLLTDADASEAEIAASADLRRYILDRAFRLSFGRPGTKEEIAACLDHWASMAVRHERLDFPRVERLTEIRRTAVEENTGENFEFRETLESSADFVPDREPGDASALERGLAEVCLALLNSNEFVYLD